MASIEERVEALIQPTIEKLGYKLYDVQYVKEASSYYLRIFIEKENGAIDLDDCEKVNDGINDILDTADYIKDQYFLEVSSTGLEKVLRKDIHLQNHIGCEVAVKVFKPIEVLEEKETAKGKKKNKKEAKIKELVGILKDFDKESITLELETGLEPKPESELKQKLEPKLEIKSQSKLEMQGNQTLNIERKNISIIKTVYHWDDEI